MKNAENNKNIFDEIDKDTETFKTAMKQSRHKRLLKKQIKILKGCTIILFILSVTLIYLDIFKGYKGGNTLAIMGLFLAIHSLVFLKLISKSKSKKGDKR